jgi:GTP-binding protein
LIGSEGLLCIVDGPFRRKRYQLVVDTLLLHFCLSPAIFEGMKVLTRFVTSAADPRQFPPPGAPEIAFIGRSNVGKSSLINSLVASKIAKTSNTPGRTQTINFFQVRRPGKPNPDFVFADLPGYGYARVPREITAKWADFINPYLEKRESLVLCLALVDVTIPPQELDLQVLEWLRHIDRDFRIVATKADRISGNQLRNSLQKLGDQLQITSDQILPFSAKTRFGHDELWAAIKTAAGVEGPNTNNVAKTG